MIMPPRDKVTGCVVSIDHATMQQHIKVRQQAGSITLTKCHHVTTQRVWRFLYSAYEFLFPFVAFAFCRFCILSYLYCIISHLHFVAFSFCYICILLHLRFVTFAFCHVCILVELYLYFVAIVFLRFVAFVF